MEEHNDALSRAFDGQAPLFERAPVQTDAAALARLVAFAALPAGAHLLDAGCGPGLVAEAFLAAGCRVTGVDLSKEMVARARARTARFGARARFEQRALGTLPREATFDAAISRFVLHHVEDPQAFLAEQASRLRAGGVLVASDLVADPDPAARVWHESIERGRDKTHTRGLTSGEIADAFARAGMAEVRITEESFDLDFDEWFDRGTPAEPKEAVRGRLLAGRARGFAPFPREGGGITIRYIRALVRGVKP